MDKMKRKLLDVDTRGYIECMDEIKDRISNIDFSLSVPRDIYALSNIEALALNFRKIFELIVMACQAAHTHLIGKRVKEWRIKNIEQMIARYNTDFYMTPVHATKDEIKDRVDVEVFSLDELKRSYTTCGQWLHAKGPYQDSLNAERAIASFKVWRTKIVGLLNAHRVRIDADTFLYCTMNAAGTGKTHVSVFGKLE
jgi:hypothetical protein